MDIAIIYDAYTSPSISIYIYVGKEGGGWASEY